MAIGTVDRTGAGFVLTADQTARLQQAPPAVGEGPPRSRWTLRAIRAAIPELAAFSRSGVWRLLQRLGMRWRQGRAQQFSPDPAYATKVTALLTCLGAAAQAPGQVEVLFLDEMGFTRWPEPGPAGDPRRRQRRPAPIASRSLTGSGGWSGRSTRGPAR